MTATSGLKCSELFKRQTPIGYLVRTLLASTDWGSTTAYLIWKPSVTKSRRRLKFRLVHWEHPTAGREFGLLPTPLTMAGHSRNPLDGGNGARAKLRKVGLLPTPTLCGNYKSKGRESYERRRALYVSHAAQWQESWPDRLGALCRMDDGVSRRLHEAKAPGNAIVPQIAYQIIKTIYDQNYRQAQGPETDQPILAT